MENLNTNPKFNTRPIGDMFYIDINGNRVFLEVVPENPEDHCAGCYFNKHNSYGVKMCCENRSDIGNCYWGLRNDKQGVIFKEVQPEPELNLCGDCPSKSCEGCPLYDNN